MTASDFDATQKGIALKPIVSERSIEPSPSLEEDEEPLWSRSKSPTTSPKAWKPLTQKTYFLIPVILASGALIATLQIFLERSQRDSGIIFASKINDLPLKRSFPYLYLPTILSLILSFSWTWIDLDAKRLQPYIQLSRKNGALGKDSILLHYPFDFAAWVPFTSIRRRHWPVFSSSVAVVVIFWGLTPLQSSIFATQTIQREFPLTLASSTSYLSVYEQAKTLTGLYAQSVYNVAWFNETLRPYMTRQGMLAPFGPVQSAGEQQTSETWTGPTRFYSVDLTCEEPIYYRKGNGIVLNSTTGCEYSLDDMRLPDHIESDQYYSLYVGYWYEESMDSYLRGYCPESENQTLLVRWSRGQVPSGTPASPSQPLEGTTLWCSSSYYQQDVNATVTPLGMSVVDVVPTGPKQALPTDLFNVTEFEWSFSQGYEMIKNRGSYPASGWPSPYERLCSCYPDLYFEDYFAYLASFALATSQRPTNDYFDPEVLGDSYQDLYRLLFAQRMVDILSSDLDHSTQTIGKRQFTTEAVIMVPVFVYVIEGLLAVIIAAAVVLLASSFRTRSNLVSEPASLASLMALSGHDPWLLQKMSSLDNATTEDLEKSLNEATLSMTEGNLEQVAVIRSIPPSHQKSPKDVSRQSRSVQFSKPMLPRELSTFFGLSFLVFQVCAIAALVYVYVRVDSDNGLPLPSTSTLVNQLIENYVPMIIAASFEPIWTMINRVLCMLQPYEQLRKGGAPASRSITLDYGSLPHQAVIMRALRAGHLSLSLVCLMSFLANLLSVAFAGLLYEDTVRLPKPTNFTVPYRFPINGSHLGNESISRNRPAYDQFYVAMSNLTAGTALPYWADEEFFYMPFDLPVSQNTTISYRATTPAVGASLNCFELRQTAANNGTSFFHGNTQLEVTTSQEGDAGCKLNISTQMGWETSQDGARAVDPMDFFSPGTLDCGIAVVAGWGRSQKLVSQHEPLNASWLGCIPTIQVLYRDVTVDGNGTVQSSAPSTRTFDLQEELFEPNSSSLVESVHKMYSADGVTAPAFLMEPTWHKDRYPSDFVNYLIATAINSSAYLNPELPPPSFRETAPILESLYAKLFAIVLATNIKKVLRVSEEQHVVSGFFLEPETRIFMSKPMFIVSLIVLSLYVLVTVALYIRRPWKVLPRMPTTIASQIGFFAASRLLGELKNTSGLSTKDRNSHIENLNHRYGFGKFVGTDGGTHLGIEREPFAQILRKKDLRTTKKRQSKKEVATGVVAKSRLGWLGRWGWGSWTPWSWRAHKSGLECPSSNY